MLKHILYDQQSFCMSKVVPFRTVTFLNKDCITAVFLEKKIQKPSSEKAYLRYCFYNLQNASNFFTNSNLQKSKFYFLADCITWWSYDKLSLQ